MSMDIPVDATLPEKMERRLTRRNLKTYLEYIWESHFADVPRVNEVQIAYCQPWKSRLGLIRMSLDETVSFIGINALLQHSAIPEYVLVTTVAHEIVHYTHGFGSPLPRLYEHPHANNIVNNELERRGLGASMKQCDAWIDKEWFAFYDRQRRSGWTEIPGIRPSRRYARDIERAG